MGITASAADQQASSTDPSRTLPMVRVGSGPALGKRSLDRAWARVQSILESGE